MDRRTGADRDSSSSLPDGQTSRGYPKADRPNPKNNASRRPEHVGDVPGQGGAVDQQTTKLQSPSGYPGTSAANRFNKGGGATEPDPGNINRGYTQVTGGNVPRTSGNISANRQRYGIDPGDVTQPDGDTRDKPGRPHFGVGTNGE